MYMIPAESKVTPNGRLIWALVAAPPSPAKPPVPVPTTVVMIPPATFRMRLLLVSTTYRFPAESTPTDPGELRDALVAAPLSPANVAVPLPATVVRTPLLSFRTRLLFWSAIYKLPALSNAMPDGEFNDALSAGPPSPANPDVPLPATVVMMPALSTLRMRLLLLSEMNTLFAASTATPHDPLI